MYSSLNDMASALRQLQKVASAMGVGVQKATQEMQQFMQEFVMTTGQYFTEGKW